MDEWLPWLGDGRRGRSQTAGHAAMSAGSWPVRTPRKSCWRFGGPSSPSRSVPKGSF